MAPSKLALLLSGLVLLLGVAASPAVAAHPTSVELRCTERILTLINNSAGSCTAVVTDEAGREDIPPITPGGSVEFITDQQGFFEVLPGLRGSICNLVTERPNESSRCGVFYRANAVGTGVHQITAIYSGDAEHPGERDEVAVTIVRPTRTSVACNPSPARLNRVTRCTTTVLDLAPIGSSAGGEVQMSTTDPSAGSFPNGPRCTLEPQIGFGGGASCSVNYLPTVPGSGIHTLNSQYLGNVTHGASQAPPTQLKVLRPTTSSVSCQPNDLGAPESTICTVTVEDSSATPLGPEGEVDFQSGGPGEFPNGETCELVVLNASRASCSVPYLAARAGTGEHLISASYPDSANHSGSQGSVALLVRDQTTTTIECTPTRLSLDAAANCLVRVKDDASLPTAPTGGVQLETDGEGTFGSCALTEVDERELTCTVTYTPTAGRENHELVASYTGDPTHRPSQGNAQITIRTLEEEEEEQKNPTVATLSCQSAVLPVDSRTICTADIEDVSGPLATNPSGEVVFEDPAGGTFTPSVCVLEDKGAVGATCELDVAFSPEGNLGDHDLVASYSGDEDHRRSSGLLTVEIIEDLDRNPTSTAVECAPAPVALNQASTCTAIVEDTVGGVAPTRLVFFENDGEGEFSDSGRCTLGSPEELPGGISRARCQLTFTPTGLSIAPRIITARYQGDLEHEDSFETRVLNIATDGGGEDGKNATTTDADCAPGSVIIGGAAVCTALVTDAAPAGRSVPTGSVEFSSDSPHTIANTCRLEPVDGVSARCQTIYTPTALDGGIHEILAGYAGDPDHEVSGDLVELTVTAPPGGGRPTETTLECQPATVVLGGVSICTVEVRDPAAAPTVPRGTVSFGSDGGGAFSSSECVLFAVARGKSRCQVVYEPAQRGPAPHLITAIYAPSADHEPSQESEPLEVVQPTNEAHDTTTALDCAPANVTVGNAATCTATVTDTDAIPTTPTRAVVFASDSAGAFDLGGCQLGQPTAAGRATCTFTYRPSAIDSGTHTIVASYAGDLDHSPSPPSSDEVTVTAPLGPPQPPAPPARPPSSGSPPQVAPPPAAAAGPDTILRKKPRKKTALRKATFIFAASQPGSTFQCKLDRKAFKPCSSPWKTKVKPGPHTFQVRAVNAQGVADPTPAQFKWKVGKSAKAGKRRR
jgi:hypothetical protein